MAECGLCPLDEGLANVGDTESSLVGRCDVVVDDRGDLEGHIIFGNADLLRDLCRMRMISN